MKVMEDGKKICTNNMQEVKKKKRVTLTERKSRAFFCLRSMQKRLRSAEKNTKKKVIRIEAKKKNKTESN